MKARYWLIFAAVQAVGCILPQFANLHSNIFPGIAAIFLLLPGSLITYLVWPACDGVWAGVMVIGINAAVFYLVLRFRDRELFD